MTATRQHSAATRTSSSWRIEARDLVLTAALLVVTLVPACREVLRPSASPGPAQKVSFAWETLNRRALAEGVIPLWNAYEFGGRPHLANSETLALYPPHVPLRLLPLELFFPISFALHAWLAGVGTYLAARYLRVSRFGSVAACGAVLCGGLLVPLESIAYSLDIYRLAWLPLIGACALRSADRPTGLPRPELVTVVALAVMASARSPMYVLVVVVASYLFSAMWPSSPGQQWTRLLVQPVMLGCLATGLTAFQMAPAVRFWTNIKGADDLLLASPPDASSAARGIRPDPPIAAALRSLGARGRILSICDRALDGSDLVALGLPGVGGHGGVFPADYARFSNLVRGPQEPVRPVFEGIPEAAHGQSRPDLLRLLGVEYLVSCEPPDLQRWALAIDSNSVGIYRSLTPAPRAFWTCAPAATGRREMEYRLRRGSYDARLMLQPNVIVNVRWPAGVDAIDRARVEAELHLAPQRDIGDRTWEYNVLDRSPENVAAIVRHPLVEDTGGIDRGTLLLAASADTPPAFDEPKSEWLLGASACDAPVPAVVQTQDRFDGGMSVEITAPRDGIVFFSETYYPDRRAWVDGRRVASMKVNMAFTGVPVPAGSHRVELRYDTSALWVGTGLSVCTLVVWLLTGRRARRRHAHR